MCFNNGTLLMISILNFQLKINLCYIKYFDFVKTNFELLTVNFQLNNKQIINLGTN